MNDLLLLAISHALIAETFRGDGAAIDDLKAFKFHRAQSERYLSDAETMRERASELGGSSLYGHENAH